MLSREVRLAGACLPDAGPVNIRPLDGADNGTADTITVRANIRCAKGTLTGAVSSGATTIALDTAVDFIAGMQAYIIHADTTVGEFFLISGVSQAPARLSVDPSTPIINSYPSGSSVYGAEEQTYAIDASGTVPVLTVTPSRGTPQPAVSGIEQMNIRYVLNRSYDPGTCVASLDSFCVVDLPSGTEWPLVRMVLLDLVARSARPVPGGGSGGFYRLSQSLQVKPRNFLF
jgi:hypothetical protein